MIELTRARILNVPVDQVWELVEPVERLPDWFGGIEAALLLGGQGLGRRQRTSGTWGSHRFEIDQTISQYEPDRALGWRHDAERLNGKPAPSVSRQTEFHVQLEALGERTRVQLTSRQLPGNVFKGFLIRLVAAPRVARMMDSSLDKLAAIIVGRSGEAGGGRYVVP